ncbi:MAG: hypothetical protein AABX01_01220 [Candidatus Micrarchaeota archaeon]
MGKIKDWLLKQTRREGQEWAYKQYSGISGLYKDIIWSFSNAPFRVVLKIPQNHLNRKAGLLRAVSEAGKDSPGLIKMPQVHPDALAFHDFEKNIIRASSIGGVHELVDKGERPNTPGIWLAFGNNLSIHRKSAYNERSVQATHLFPLKGGGAILVQERQPGYFKQMQAANLNEAANPKPKKRARPRPERPK